MLLARAHAARRGARMLAAAPAGTAAARAAACTLRAGKRHYAAFDETPHQYQRRGDTTVGLVAVGAIGASLAAAYAYVHLTGANDSDPAATDPEANRAEPAPTKQFDTTGLREDAPGVPAVYVWGTNAFGLVDPQLDVSDPAILHAAGTAEHAPGHATLVRFPRKLRFFDGQRLRGLVLAEGSAAAIDANGDVYQWGASFSSTPPSAPPTKTIVGHNVVQVALTHSHLYALTANGALHVLPVAADAHAAVAGAHPVRDAASGFAKRGWLPFVSSAKSNLAAFPRMDARDAGSGKAESIAHVAAGDAHVVALTKSGAAYSGAVGASAVAAGAIGRDPTFDEQEAAGALAARVDGKGDVPIAAPALAPIRTLPAGDAVVRAACGRAHTLLATRSGRAFAFGSNSHGQLMLGEWSRANAVTPLPVEVALPKRGRQVTEVHAAGDVSAVVTVGAAASASSPASAAPQQPGPAMPAVEHELWTAGNGALGALGAGKFAHVEPAATRVRALSSRAEWSDAAGTMQPLAPRGMALAPAHAACILAPVHADDARAAATVFAWGSGGEYATGTGKRSHAATPAPAAPLPWRYGFRAGARDVAGPENGDGVEQMVVGEQWAVAAGPGVTAVYCKAQV